MFIVYEIINNINNKGYIGYSGRTLKQRWSSHISSANQGSPFRFHSAIRKHGHENFSIQVLYEFDSIDAAKVMEETLILERDYLNVGYNAKPGGCGGHIVPKDKLESWKAKLSERFSGAGNANYSGLTDTDIVNVALECTKVHGKIPSHETLIAYGISVGVKIPKHFTKFRFNGRYHNLVNIIEELTELKYNPYFRSPEHRKLLSDSFKGKKLTEKHKKNIKLGLQKRYHGN